MEQLDFKAEDLIRMANKPPSVLVGPCHCHFYRRRSSQALRAASAGDRFRPPAAAL